MTTCEQTRADRTWVDEAIRRVEADANRSSDTHLLAFDLPGRHGIDLYLKDESSHPTGSLKHRLARSLFLYALCNGWIGPTTTVVEASSGSTAVSEAYFARLLGLPFIAVVPATTSPAKVELIEWHGGRCEVVAHPGQVYDEARRLATELGGHYLDQFTYAERATDWRGNNNIAESIFEQMSGEAHPVPAWIVASAGTGGTAATIGRYLRYRRHPTRLLVPDPENSVFLDAWRLGDRGLRSAEGSRIEGIGRPRVEPSFVPEVIDEMVRVPDAASVATMLWTSRRLGRRVGPSTGTSMWATLRLIARLERGGERGSVVSLICDGGERYASTYYDASWRACQGIDVAPYLAVLDEYERSGSLAGVIAGTPGCGS
ncbi:PLP-dependent cysteine synthase family protein [Micromonospora sp. B11E3]|uniref:PLP-dependent cysteine synthase family protein n=1 Tax=Micromonospora sp. B11E3 TaxID=3153562 RepID=UPI00325CFC52